MSVSWYWPDWNATPPPPPERVIHDCDPAAETCYCGEPDEDEARRIAEVFDEARAEMDRGL